MRLPAMRYRQHTFQGRKTAIENEFKVAELALRQDERGQRLGLGGQLGVPWLVADEQVLELAAVR